LNSTAITKAQSLLLIGIIVVGAVGGSAAYVLWNNSLQPAESIKIGVCADLNAEVGKGIWQAAILAAEQINAQGGVLGRNLTIVAEDDDDESGAGADTLANAMTKLITVDNASFVISGAIGPTPVFTHQDICADQKTIMLGVKGANLEFTQRVLDNYERYKYYFKAWERNSTVFATSLFEEVLAVGKYTGLSKVALLFTQSPATEQMTAFLKTSLPTQGFEVVYSNYFSAKVTDFTSFFAAAEEAGAEIFVPLVMGQAAVSFVKEYTDRQSPMIVAGSVGSAEDPEFWELTEGKCQYVCFNGIPMLADYPWTNQTLPMRDAYIERWGTMPVEANVVAAYDAVRFILPDAIKRAGTIETEAVIKALEATDVETAIARHFVFTSSHDVFVGVTQPREVDKDHPLVCMYQWQGKDAQTIVGPEEIMNEMGKTFKLPPWKGPWSER
jgi:branched-chain amino acid transport system substrate-binding protein